MKPLNAFAISLAILTSTPLVRASVPIIVATPQRMQAAMKMVTDAQDLLQKGDVAGLTQRPRYPSSVIGR